MPRKGFVANKRNIGRMLRDDPGIGRALDAIAEPIADRAGGDVVKQTTDRQVRLVRVSAEAQAVDGVATKAANEVRAFSTRRQWRAAFASGAPDASKRARASDSYRSLPEGN